MAEEAADGQKESEKHGSGRPPSARFNDEHFAGGEHHDDLDHQAILGSKKTAQEFDHLPAGESKARLRTLAKKMDTNGDGYISRDELIDWIYKSMLALDQEETDERFEEIDTDKDGYVTWEEYMADAFVEPEEASTAEDLKLMEEDKQYFHAADVIKDGKLDRKEFSAFQNPENHPSMHDTLLDVTMKEKDADGDGLISYTEFMGEAGEDPKSEWYQIEKERFENDYDKDKDGVLEREEVRAWLVPDPKMTAIEETDHLFRQADHNKDEQLSYDEIVDEHKLFVGSEATGYGDQLGRDEL